MSAQDKRGEVCRQLVKELSGSTIPTKIRGERLASCASPASFLKEFCQEFCKERGYDPDLFSLFSDSDLSSLLTEAYVCAFQNLCTRSDTEFKTGVRHLILGAAADKHAGNRFILDAFQAARGGQSSEFNRRVARSGISLPAVNQGQADSEPASADCHEVAKEVWAKNLLVRFFERAEQKNLSYLSCAEEIAAFKSFCQEDTENSVLSKEIAALAEFYPLSKGLDYFSLQELEWYLVRSPHLMRAFFCENSSMVRIADRTFVFGFSPLRARLIHSLEAQISKASKEEQDDLIRFWMEAHISSYGFLENEPLFLEPLFALAESSEPVIAGCSLSVQMQKRLISFLENTCNGASFFSTANLKKKQKVLSLNLQILEQRGNAVYVQYFTASSFKEMEQACRLKRSEEWQRANRFVSEQVDWNTVVKTLLSEVSAEKAANLLASLRTSVRQTDRRMGYVLTSLSPALRGLVERGCIPVSVGLTDRLDPPSVIKAPHFLRKNECRNWFLYQDCQKIRPVLTQYLQKTEDVNALLVCVLEGMQREIAYHQKVLQSVQDHPKHLRVAFATAHAIALAHGLDCVQKLTAYPIDLHSDCPETQMKAYQAYVIRVVGVFEEIRNQKEKEKKEQSGHYVLNLYAPFYEQEMALMEKTYPLTLDDQTAQALRKHIQNIMNFVLADLKRLASDEGTIASERRKIEIAALNAYRAIYQDFCAGEQTDSDTIKQVSLKLLKVTYSHLIKNQAQIAENRRKLAYVGMFIVFAICFFVSLPLLYFKPHALSTRSVATVDAVIGEVNKTLPFVEAAEKKERDAAKSRRTWTESSCSSASGGRRSPSPLTWKIQGQEFLSVRP